jgi:hypothetical protein
VFDPSAHSLEETTWWWNPLSYVTDEVRAARLAEHFAAGSRDPGARTDAYFDPARQDLLAGLLLTAALDGRAITDVHTWLTRPTDETAVDVLREHGFPLTAGAVAAPETARRHLRPSPADGLLPDRPAGPAWVNPAGAGR